MACVNVANLLLARATFRQREVALRLAIGATRGRVVRQLLTESALLAIGGAVLGAVLASLGSQALFAMVADMRVGPDVEGIKLDLSTGWRILTFTTLLAAATTALFGVLPALRAGRVEPMHAIETGSWRLAQSRGRLGAALVTLQVALSLLLLISAGLFGQTVRNLRAVERGFRHEGVLVVGIDHSRVGRTGEDLSAFLREIVAMVERVPGVQSVSLSAITPLQGGGISQAIAVAGRPMEPTETYYNNVGPRFFEALGTPVVAGREFTAQDEWSGDGVAIVNEAFVRRYLRDVDPLGERLNVSGFRVGGASRELRIVGVVRDAAYETLRANPPPTVYGPFINRSPRAVALVVHAPGALEAVSSTIRRDVQPMLGGRLVRMRTLTAQLENSLTRERLMATVASVFGSLALALAALGLYGLLAYWVARRTHEIGIRLALGARRSAILAAVIGDAFRMTVFGAAAGLAVALSLSRFVSSMMFGLTSSDPFTIASAIVVLLVVGLVAAWLPARRATQVNPVAALRAE
jgi:predicted permease